MRQERYCPKSTMDSDLKRGNNAHYSYGRVFAFLPACRMDDISLREGISRREGGGSVQMFRRLKWRRLTMLPTLPPLLQHLKNRFLNQEGQDLVEYALIVAMLSFCAVAAERNVANSISQAYLNLANTFNADL
jgi:Flp pilus assembly pilin Flp